MSKECVSVIVPIYNVEQYLEKCIESICCQTYENLQIILVNDGSTDGCRKICADFAERDSRIVMVDKENGGLVAARKAGIKKANGAYAIYVDGDDWIEKDLVEKMLEGLAKDVDMVCAGHLADFGDESVKMAGSIYSGVLESSQVVEQMLSTPVFFSTGVTPYVWSKLFKMDLLRKIQLSVDETISFGEDVGVTYNGILHSKRISFIDYKGYHYVQRQTSISYNNYEDEYVRCKALIDYLKESLTKDDRYRDVIIPQINDYKKLLYMLRLHSQLDECVLGRGTNEVLGEFGGISRDSRVLLYGAGNYGKAVHRYLKSFPEIEITGWLDKSYSRYISLGMPVSDPMTWDYGIDCDVVIVAISNEKTAKSVCQFLNAQGVKATKIRMLCQSFLVDYDIEM